MTPAEFRAARDLLGLTQAQIGALIPSNRGGYTNGRTVRRWESGQSGIAHHVPAVVEGLIEEYLAGILADKAAQRIVAKLMEGKA